MILIKIYNLPHVGELVTCRVAMTLPKAKHGERPFIIVNDTSKLVGLPLRCMII